MKTFFRVVKAVLFSYCIAPISYVLSVATIVACAVRFLLVFFSAQGGSDLRPLFSAVPYVSVLTVPLVVFRARAFIADDSLPVASFTKLAAVTIASFCVFAFPLIALLAVPCAVQAFGDVELGQLAASYLGVLLYGFAACALVVFLFALCAGGDGTGGVGVILPLFVSALVLLAVNSLHKLPLYVKPPALLSFLLQQLSFAWHFDAASKGVFDSRDLFFYLFASFDLLLLASACEYRRTGRRISRLSAFLVASICVTGGAASYRLHARGDATAARAFSLSALSRELLAELDAPLRITYYRSRELKQLYPQTNDVAEFLALYAGQGRRVSLQIENADDGRNPDDAIQFVCR